MHDAHYHLSKKILDYKLDGICNVANPSEFEIAQKYHLFYSCGVHPWQASLENLKKMKPYLKIAPIIGEIGMDNVWCDVNLDVQKKVFEEQVKFAKNMHKPVLLHTKGQEKEILDIIKKYPNTYIVHWYGCMDYVKEYDGVVSYFTVGPSIGKEKAVTHLVKMISLEKLLLETDGIEAVKWAIDSTDYLQALQNEVTQIAKIKNKSYEETEHILDTNFKKLKEIIN